MSHHRLSFRPRPLDIHKKLPIVKSLSEFNDDDSFVDVNHQLLSTRGGSGSGGGSSVFRFDSAGAIADNIINQVHHIPTKKIAPEIPTPKFLVVDTYERDYSCTFVQPTSYLRGRGALFDIGEFVEYDLDNEDEDWLQDFNKERAALTPEKFEILLFNFEVLDHKARERAGVITSTLGPPVSILLQLDTAIEALQSQSVRYAVFQTVYNYWKAKRQRWQKPILRQLQPPPPVNDTNPYNVFRPREKVHRLHTRRMQRRENNVQSFEKLRMVRRNLDQAKMALEALIQREEKKREVMENEVSLQRIQMKFNLQSDAQLVEDGLALGNASISYEDEFGDSDDMFRYPHTSRNPLFIELNLIKRDYTRQPTMQGWLPKRDPNEPILLFTKPIDPDKLSSAGIVPPSNPSEETSPSSPQYRFHGRMGRGGRIIFDRWNPLGRTHENSPSNCTPLPQG